MLVCLLSLLLAPGCTQKESSPVTIHLAGDSTMADKREPERNPERGWGQMLHLFFMEEVRIVNHAVNGRSTKSFLDEGRWTRLTESLKPGDYVFIQFGHNDQKENDPARYGNAYSGYRRNLERMVGDCRDRGAFPVLMSSIVRRKFNEQGTLVDTHGPYPFVARMVAQAMDVPFIDLQQQTEDLVSGLGPGLSAGLYMILEPGESEMYPEGRTDNSHLNVQGATEVARMVAASVKELDLPLAAWLDPVLETPRVLAITGGHAYDTTAFRQMLASLEGIRFDTLSCPYALHLLASPYAATYDALLFYDFQPDLDLRDSAVFTGLTVFGMPLLFLHHAICSFQRWEGYREMVGGRYVMEGYGHGSLSAAEHDLDLQVLISDPSHPVTRGMEDITIHDEAYSGLDILEGVTPLLETGDPACSSPMGWTHRYRNSKVVYLMPGHDHHAYEHPAYRELLENSISYLTED
jgi:lysophospholipase L1-like esterase